MGTQSLGARRAISVRGDILLGSENQTPRFGDLVRRETIGFCLLGCSNGLSGIAHLLDRWRDHAAKQQDCCKTACGYEPNSRAETHLRYSFRMNIKIYHNPRCSKSRATLALLQDRGHDIEVIEYLKNPLQANEIKDLLGKLGLAPAAILRTGEAAFRESGLSADSAPTALIELMVKEPIVIERPIVVVGDQARIGRPPERVLELIP